MDALGMMLLKVLFPLLQFFFARLPRYIGRKKSVQLSCKLDSLAFPYLYVSY
jgi:hypothetical protein